MKTLMASLLALVIVAVTVMAIGRVAVTPSPAGYGVLIDSDWSDVRRVEELQRTERARIEAATVVTVAQEREQTARIVWPLVAVAVAAGAVGIAWSRRPHRPVAPTSDRALLLVYAEQRQRLGFDVTVEKVGGEWMAVDHGRRLLLPVGAVAKQLELHQ